MANFVQNTIFTKHGLNRLDEFIYRYTRIHTEDGTPVTDTTLEPDRFQFSEVVISDVVSPLSIDTTSLANEIFSLPIEEVEFNNNILSIHCTLTADITGLNLIQVGVYELINGQRYLFGFGNVDSYKPDTDFGLVIKLEINLETLQMYKDRLNILINQPDIVHAKDGNNLVDTFADVFEILQHSIKRNREEFGNQPIQDGFYHEDWRHNIVNDTARMLRYVDTYKVATPSNILVFKDTKDFSYEVKDLLNKKYLSVEDGRVLSDSNMCNFTNSNTLIVRSTFSLLDGIVLNNINPLDVEDYNFKYEVIDKNIILTIKGARGSLTFTTPISEWIKAGLDLDNRGLLQMITLDGDTIKYYLNGKEVIGTTTVDNFEPLTTVNNSERLLSNYISSTSQFNDLYKIHSISFYDRCLSEAELTEVLKTFNYTFA